MNVEEKILQHDRLLRNIFRNKLAPNSDCYTIEEAADAIGCTVETVKGKIKRGEIRCKYPNARACITYEDLDRYLKGLSVK